MRLRRALMLLLLLGVSLMPGTSQGAAHPLPDELTLVCDDGGAQLATEVVTPRADGVHLRIVNRTDEVLSVVAAGDAAGFAYHSAPPGVSFTVVDVAPGRVRLACSEATVRDPLASASARVLDVDDLYVEPVLECPPGEGAAYVDWMSPAPTDWDGYLDPDMAAAAYLHFEWEPGDSVTHIGYPEVPSAVFVQLRKGRAVARLDLVKEGDLWYPDTREFCTEVSGL